MAKKFDKISPKNISEEKFNQLVDALPSSVIEQPKPFTPNVEKKEKVNKIKRRQEFRPFAPIILQEHVHDYFEMPGGVSDAPYMQYVARCKKPEEFPAIVHADGTSRVQTVNKEQHPELYELMTQFYNKTGCPMILNTSLNVKGMPIVNDERDAKIFQDKYNVPVHIKDD